METPQLENGYIRIANEIVLAFCRYYPGGVAGQVLTAIIRQTYGWNKKEDFISISQIINLTGASKRGIIYALQELEAKKIIFIHRSIKNHKKQPNLITFNKNYKEWMVQNSAPQVKKNRQKAKENSAKLRTTKVNSAKLGNLVVQNSVKTIQSFAHTKDTITKNNITKDSINSNVNPLLSKFKTVNPSYERLFANKTQRDAISRLVKKYGEQKMNNLLEQLPSIIQRPYAPSITTPYELESKMGKLILFLKQDQVKNYKFQDTKV